MGLCPGVKHRHNPPEGLSPECCWSWSPCLRLGEPGRGWVAWGRWVPPWAPLHGHGAQQSIPRLPRHLTLLARYGYMGASGTPRHSPMEPSLVETFMTAALLQLSPSFPASFAAFSRSGRNSLHKDTDSLLISDKP